MTGRTRDTTRSKTVSNSLAEAVWTHYATQAAAAATAVPVDTPWTARMDGLVARLRGDELFRDSLTANNRASLARYAAWRGNQNGD